MCSKTRKCQSHFSRAHFFLSLYNVCVQYVHMYVRIVQCVFVTVYACNIQSVLAVHFDDVKRQQGETKFPGQVRQFEQ